MKLNNDLYEHLIADEFFIDVVKRNQNGSWEDLIKKYPQDFDTLIAARGFIESLNFKKEYLDLNRIESIKNRIEDNIDINENKRTISRYQINPWVWRAASVILVVSIAFAFAFFFNQPQGQEIAETQVIRKSTHKGQRMTTNLPDGTVVKLNASSTIRYELPFTSTVRTIYLEGEAFFEVKEDSLRPFTVITKDVSTVVLGTSFNVKNRPGEEIEVALVSGKVKVFCNNEEVYLLPGEMAHSGANNSLKVQEFDYPEKIGWKDKILVFKTAEFKEIMERLSLWYGVEFTLNNEIPNVTYEGRFDDTSLTEVMDGLAFVYHFDYKINGNNIELTFNLK